MSQTEKFQEPWFWFIFSFYHKIFVVPFCLKFEAFRKDMLF